MLSPKYIEDKQSGGKKMKKLIAVVTLGFVLSFYVFVSSSLAQENTTDDKIGDKFSRGVVNTSLGWVDFPKTIYYESTEKNVAYGLTVGAVKGIGHSVTRTLVGVYDVVTFPFPYPNDYKPLMKPDYVLQPGGIRLYSSPYDDYN